MSRRAAGGLAPARVAPCAVCMHCACQGACHAPRCSPLPAARLVQGVHHAPTASFTAWPGLLLEASVDMAHDDTRRSVAAPAQPLHSRPARHSMLALIVAVKSEDRRAVFVIGKYKGQALGHVFGHGTGLQLRSPSPARARARRQHGVGSYQRHAPDGRQHGVTRAGDLGQARVRRHAGEQSTGMLCSGGAQ